MFGRFRFKFQNSWERSEKKKKKQRVVHRRVWERDIEAGTNAEVLRLASNSGVWGVGGGGGSVVEEGKGTELGDEQEATLASSYRAL